MPVWDKDRRWLLLLLLPWVESTKPRIDTANSGTPLAEATDSLYSTCFTCVNVEAVSPNNLMLMSPSLLVSGDPVEFGAGDAAGGLLGGGVGIATAVELDPNEVMAYDVLLLVHVLEVGLTCPDEPVPAPNKPLLNSIVVGI